MWLPGNVAKNCQLNGKYWIYPKYLDTSTPYYTCSNIWISTIFYPMLCLKIAGWVANSVDPDEMPRGIYTVCSVLSVQIHVVNMVVL